MDDTLIKLNKGKPIYLKPAPKPSDSLEWSIEQLTIIAEAFGERVTPQRLAIYAGELADIEQPQLAVAFRRTRRECRFFPKIAELRAFAEAVDEEAQQQAEAHRAWDVLLDYVDTWIHPDPEGSYGPEQGCRTYPPPVLDQRILDCARRLGGWRRLKTADEDDVPFLKKDFIDEYFRWDAVAHVDASRMLKEVCPTLQLRPMDPGPENIYQCRGISSLLKSEQTPIPQPKSVNCEPLTDIDIRDRREMLRQQAARMMQNRSR